VELIAYGNLTLLIFRVYGCGCHGECHHLVGCYHDQTHLSRDVQILEGEEGSGLIMNEIINLNLSVFVEITRMELTFNL